MFRGIAAYAMMTLLVIIFGFFAVANYAGGGALGEAQHVVKSHQ